MEHEKKIPAAALASATDREVDVKTIAAVSDNSNTKADCLSFQAAYVSQRYRLSPCMARLICQLAQIGGRMA